MRNMILALFLCWFSVWAAEAQTKQYEVMTETYLNIRSGASTSAPVIATIDRGGVVEVYEITDGWAKIAFGDGVAYVSADYLKPVSEVALPEESSSDSWFTISSLKLSGYDVKWMVYLIAALSLVLFIMRKRRPEGEALEGNEYILNTSLFAAVAVLELIYALTMGADTVWFCQPDTVGWLWTIVGFIIFGAVVVNQLMCFFDVLDDVQYNSEGFFDRRWGFYSWIGLLAGGIVAAFLFSAALPVLFCAFLVCQIVQIVLIFKGVVPYGGWGKAFVCLGVYLVGSMATVLIIVHFVALLIIVLLGLLVLYIVSKMGSSSSGRRCSNCSHYSGGYCSLSGRYISNADRKICDNYS